MSKGSLTLAPVWSAIWKCSIFRGHDLLEKPQKSNEEFTWQDFNERSRRAVLQPDCFVWASPLYWYSGYLPRQGSILWNLENIIFWEKNLTVFWKQTGEVHLLALTLCRTSSYHLHIPRAKNALQCEQCRLYTRGVQTYHQIIVKAIIVEWQWRSSSLFSTEILYLWSFHPKIKILPVTYFLLLLTSELFVQDAKWKNKKTSGKSVKVSHRSSTSAFSIKFSPWSMQWLRYNLCHLFLWFIQRSKCMEKVSGLFRYIGPA